ncbi:TniQ family protein [Aneurinibacillus sp. BA2021]|nr:TniQ family protein [Aneurinibacillus sp. BA2021]
MLPFFPTPYSNELLYSILARYHNWSQNGLEKYTLNDLFGYERATPIVLFPNRISELCKRLNPKSLHTPDSIIERHTIYPLYHPFLLKERSAKLKGLMLGSHASNIYSTLGSSSVEQVPTLRYCIKCVIEDREEHGEAYWHREHQITYVIGCHKHGIKLKETTVYTSRKYNHAQLITLEDYLSSIDENLLLMEEISQLEKEIAKDVYWFLNTKSLSVNLEMLCEVYFEHLVHLGFATISGWINRKKLFKAFVNYYGEDILNKFNSNVKHSRNDCWIDHIVKKHDLHFIHPVRHLVFIRFLGYSPEEFLNIKKSKNSLFGKAPWPCLNVACSYFGKRIIKEYTIHQQNRKLQGAFACPKCDFIYVRSGPDKNKSDRNRFDYIKNYGSVWEEKFIEMYKKGYTGKMISEVLNISLSTVSSKIKKFKETNEFPQKNCFFTKRENCRQIWLNVFLNHPGESKTELSKKVPTVFSWLMIHDRDWLKENTPLSRRKGPENIPGRKTGQWGEIDDDFSVEVLTAITELKNTEERITKESIGRKVKKLGYVTASLHKLPKTQKIILEFIESHEEFRIRRIKIAAQKIRERGETVTESKLFWTAVRKKKYLTQEVKEQILEEVYGDST